MTERERWIVYPLVFLAISVSLKSKFVPSTKLEVDQLKAKQITSSLILGERASFNELNAPLIHAHQIQVADRQNIPKIILRTLSLPDTDQDDSAKTMGIINLLGQKNQELVTIGGSQEGGFVVTISSENHSDYIAFGYDQRGSGLFWLDKQGQPKGFFRRKIENTPQNPAATDAEGTEEKVGTQAAAPTEKQQGSPEENTTPTEGEVAPQ